MNWREKLDQLVQEGRMHRGTIEGFSGSWLSEIGHLIIDDVPYPCENAPTVRALDGAFGDVIAPSHCVDSNAIRGKEIFFSLDDIGLFTSFTPIDDEDLDREWTEEDDQEWAGEG